MDRRIFLTLAGAALAAPPAQAAPRAYALDKKRSVVAFSYRLNDRPINGRMPVASADIALDIDRPQNSRVSAEINAARADAGPFYATQAMKSPSVLDTINFPIIRFQSKTIRGTLQEAQITGALTIRDVTKDITLAASIFRERGTEAGDRSKLSILMTGAVDRRRYGASGFANLVGPTIQLKILTRIVLA